MTITWQKNVIGAGLRLDCIESLGDGKMISASRTPVAGLVFRAENITRWRHVATVGTAEITALANAGAGVVYMMDGNSKVWKSVDYGDNWTDLGTLSSSTHNAFYLRAYGLIVTSAGTVLAADMATAGGRIFRSTDGGVSFTDLGAIGSDGLYTFAIDGTTILIGDLSGRVFKSTDDGQTWASLGQLTASQCWGLCVVSSGVYLTGHQNGQIYRTTDGGLNWTLITTLGGAVDYMGSDGTRCIASTFSSGNVLHESSDGGLNWSSASAIPTQSGDYISRGVVVDGDFVCSTEQGFAVYSSTSITFESRTPWDLDQVSGAIWCDASLASTLYDATSGGSLVAAEGTVARFEDRTGNARHLLQATSGKRPVRKFGVIAGLDMLRFDGSDDAIGLASTDAAQNVSGLSIFCVASGATSSGSYLVTARFRTGTDVDRAGLYQRSNTLEVGGRRLDANAYQFVQHGTVTGSLPRVLGAIFDFSGATLNALANGGQTARSGGFQTAGNSSNTAGRFELGGWLNGSGQTITGDIGELFVVSSAVDSETRDKIIGRLHWKWGLSYLLPFGHPYKSEPPFLASSPVRRQCPQCLGVGVI